jgi:hypothetical protein
MALKSSAAKVMKAGQRKMILPTGGNVNATGVSDHQVTPMPDRLQ